MIQRHNRLNAVAISAYTLIMSALPAVAHPGVHPAPDHSYHLADVAFAVAALAGLIVFAVCRLKARD